MRYVMVGVILAAGDGTRLKNNLSEDCCKVLQKVNNQYLIEYALNNLVELGVKEVYIVVGKHHDLIKRVIGNVYKNLTVFYVYQPQQKGLINAFVQALTFVQDNVVLQLADEIFAGLKTSEIKEQINSMDFDFLCGITYENNRDKIKNNFSVECDEMSIIKKCTEKPDIVINNNKGTGFCIFRAETLNLLKEVYNETDNYPRELCDFINYLTVNGKKAVARCIAEKEFNINTLSDLEEARAFYC